MNPLYLVKLKILLANDVRDFSIKYSTNINISVFVVNILSKYSVINLN